MSGSSPFPSLPRLNEPAPDFTAPSTQGPLSLAGLRGRWVVLFSHPADFTPVCSTEIVEFARRNQEFENLNTQLLGLSTDSIYAHIAWIRSMETQFEVAISFPMIADLDRHVSTLYGMIHPGVSGTSTVRCLFVIDTEGMLRAMIYYPLTTGRNVAEILRLVRALQLSDAQGLATPANWQPGDSALLPAPTTTGDAQRRIEEEGLEVTEWYLTKRI